MKMEAISDSSLYILSNNNNTKRRNRIERGREMRRNI
jgi:hypothetical protein